MFDEVEFVDARVELLVRWQHICWECRYLVEVKLHIEIGSIFIKRKDPCVLKSLFDIHSIRR
jgi:hypothetical protein